MNKLKFFLVLFLLVSFMFSANTQTDLFTSFISKTDYNECAAILYNGKMLVDEYSPTGKCILEEDAKGELSLSTMLLSDETAQPIKSLNFYVAIKNVKTNTYFMMTPKAIDKIQIEYILKHCHMGDEIIIMTEDMKYSLTHHKIKILWKC